MSRPLPELLSQDENAELLSDAEILWRELQENELGGFSDRNRPFWILHQFKMVIEKFGRRDVGLTWSRDALDAARAKENGS